MTNLPPSQFGAGYTVGGAADEPSLRSGYVATPQHAPVESSTRPQYADTTSQTAGQASYYGTPVVGTVLMPVRKTNSMAIAALVSALTLAPLGIVFGHIALSQMKRSGEEGRGLAVAGLVIGYISTAVWLIIVIAYIAYIVFWVWLTNEVNSDWIAPD